MLIVLTLVIISWVLCIRWQRRRIWQIARELPSDIPMMPVVGHAYIFVGNAENRTMSLLRIGREAIIHGGLCSIWVVNKLYIYIADPVAADLLTKGCLEKNELLIKFGRDVTGKGTIFASAKEWRPRRKIMASMFSQKILNGFVEIFSRQSAVMVEQLRPMVGAGDFSVWQYVVTYTFDSVSETNFGINLNSQKHSHPFLDAIDKIMKLVFARLWDPCLHSSLVYRLLPDYKEYQKNLKYFHGFIDKVVEEKWESMTSPESNVFAKNAGCDEQRSKSFLEMIIESTGGDKNALLELSDEIKILLIAGTDTSAVAASFTLLLLSRYPSVQDTVYEELHSVLGKSDRPITAEDLPKLKYLEVVIKESLRLYPPVPIQLREVYNDITLPCGTTLVNGVGVMVHAWAMHRNPLYWGADAEQFRPERFLEGPLEHPAQFIAFSYGIRNCIGYQYAMMSLKTVLASFLRAYRVFPPVGLPPEHFQDPLPVQIDIMLRHKDNFTLRIEKRT